jgi:hypothetical protein
MHGVNYGSGSADDLREACLTVAVHNDYRLDGLSMTFWLMTWQPRQGPGVAFKGEGRTDAEALDQIRNQVERWRDG